jgi:lysophospholipase L1-like esterase
MFVGGEEKSHQLAEAFAKVSEQRGFCWINAGDILQSSPLDGIHLEPSEHTKLGKAVAEYVREIL